VPNVKLDRETLAKFLPDQPSIRAFEKVLEYVADVGPDGLEELFSLLSGMRQNNTSAITTKLAEIDQQPSRRVNLSPTLDRLDAIEQQLRQRSTNLTAILARLDKLEQFTGV
jgi:hypothetical protein